MEHVYTTFFFGPGYQAMIYIDCEIHFVNPYYEIYRIVKSEPELIKMVV